MENVCVLPREFAADYIALNPDWQKTVEAKFDRPSSGLFCAKETDISQLVKDDPNNIYIDLRELMKGYKLRSKRDKVIVIRPDGDQRYDGWHSSIEGIFRPKPLGQGHIQKNPTIAEKALIAFKDNDKVYVFSEGGSNLMIYDPSGEECALYGAPFDEVHPFGVIIPVYRISFKAANRFCFETPNQTNQGIKQIGAAKFVLGRKGDKWTLNNIFGEQFAESDDKQKLLHIVLATPEQFGDGLDFYAIEHVDKS